MDTPNPPPLLPRAAGPFLKSAASLARIGRRDASIAGNGDAAAR